MNSSFNTIDIYSKFENEDYRTVSEAELIYTIVGNEKAAKDIYSEAEENLINLTRLTFNDLIKIPGIGKKTAAQIISVAELARRKERSNRDNFKTIRCSMDAYDSIKSDLQDLNHEEFWMLLVNRRNKVIKKILISKGGTSETVADVKIIMKKAIERSASGIILAHNHPSGNTTASAADDNLTHRIERAAKLFDIRVLDHIIVGDNRYSSYADEGKLI